MLKVIIPSVECFDEKTQTFINTDETVLELEHSLVSLSKWESKWHKPFLTKDKKTKEETLDYFRCMTLTPNVDPLVYYTIPKPIYDQIDAYLNDSMTATWFSEQQNNKFNREIVTSELIYYWMVSLQIPFDCENWHLNRLMTLVKVCNIKNGPQKKMNRRDVVAQYAAINAARRQKLGTNG